MQPVATDAVAWSICGKKRLVTLSTYRRYTNNFIYLSVTTMSPSKAAVWENRLLRSLLRYDRADQVLPCVCHFLLTPKMCCWSCKTLITIHWIRLRVNGIRAMWFSHSKLITERRSLRDAFSGSVYKRCHSEVIITALTPDDQNYISYKMHLSDLFIFHTFKN